MQHLWLFRIPKFKSHTFPKMSKIFVSLNVFKLRVDVYQTITNYKRDHAYKWYIYICIYTRNNTIHPRFHLCTNKRSIHRVFHVWIINSITCQLCPRRRMATRIFHSLASWIESSPRRNYLTQPIEQQHTDPVNRFLPRSAALSQL